MEKDKLLHLLSRIMYLIGIVLITLGSLNDSFLRVTLRIISIYCLIQFLFGSHVSLKINYGLDKNSAILIYRIIMFIVGISTIIYYFLSFFGTSILNVLVNMEAHDITVIRLVVSGVLIVDILLNILIIRLTDFEEDDSSWLFVILGRLSKLTKNTPTSIGWR